MQNLNNNQKLFCQYYVENGLNGTQAYTKAYKTKNEETARKNASRLLTNADIRAYISELQAKIEDKAIMSATERMKWLSKVINGEVKEESKYWDDHECIVYEKEADINTKIKAIDTLNKMDNSYQQNIKISGSISNPYTNLSEEELRKLAGD